MQNAWALWDSNVRTAGPRAQVSPLSEAEISAFHISRPINNLDIGFLPFHDFLFFFHGSTLMTHNVLM